MTKKKKISTVMENTVVKRITVEAQFASLNFKEKRRYYMRDSASRHA